MLVPKGPVGRLQRRASSHVRSLCCRFIAPSLIYEEYRYPFREPLHSIVMSVMGVMSGTYPDTYGILCMTMDRCCAWSPSCLRHVYHHCGNLIYKRFSDYHDDDDAHDDGLRAYSKQGMRLYFVGLYPFALEHPNSAIQAVLILLAIETITSVTIVTTFWKGVDPRWG
jgi:hypothetical protein